jgi:hypothetical protein
LFFYTKEFHSIPFRSIDFAEAAKPIEEFLTLDAGKRAIRMSLFVVVCVVMCVGF